MCIGKGPTEKQGFLFCVSWFSKQSTNWAATLEELFTRSRETWGKSELKMDTSFSFFAVPESRLESLVLD